MAADDDQQSGQKKTCSQRCDDLSRSLWNAEKREVLGRTAQSWGKLAAGRLLND